MEPAVASGLSKRSSWQKWGNSSQFVEFGLEAAEKLDGVSAELEAEKASTAQSCKDLDFLAFDVGKPGALCFFMSACCL